MIRRYSISRASRREAPAEAFRGGLFFSLFPISIPFAQESGNVITCKDKISPMSICRDGRTCILCVLSQAPQGNMAVS